MVWNFQVRGQGCNWLGCPLTSWPETVTSCGPGCRLQTKTMTFTLTHYPGDFSNHHGEGSTSGTHLRSSFSHNVSSLTPVSPQNSSSSKFFSFGRAEHHSSPALDLISKAKNTTILPGTVQTWDFHPKGPLSLRGQTMSVTKDRQRVNIFFSSSSSFVFCFLKKNFSTE